MEHLGKKEETMQRGERGVHAIEHFLVLSFQMTYNY